MLLLVIPVFLGGAANEINAIVGRSLVSTLDEGSVSSLNYAFKTMQLFTGIFVASISVVLYPKIAAMYAKNDMEGYSTTVRTTLEVLALFTVPVTIIAIIASQDIIRIMFERGNFRSSDTLNTSKALICYSIGLTGIAFRDILSKAFYSAKNTKTPMINGAISAAINIPLTYILIRLMNHSGAALAASLVSLFCSILLFISFNRKIIRLDLKKMSISFVKTIVSSILCGCIFYPSFQWIVSLQFSFAIHILLLVAAFVFSFGAYILFQTVLKNDLLRNFFKK